MSQKILTGVCAAVLALGIACSRTAYPTSPSVATTGVVANATDSVTLKIGAPTLVSPINGFQFQPQTSVMLTIGNVQGTYTTFPVTYEVEIHDATSAVVADVKFAAAAGATTSTVVTSTLAAGAPMTWRARATYNGGNGPWSGFASFTTPIQQVRDFANSFVFDPLTTGTTVGSLVGPGHFVAGQGYELDSLASGVDYDLATCTSCTVQFDVTGVGNGLGNPADLKWITMGDGSLFDSFNDLRDQDWKMHLEQRGDGDGTGMKITWRNGCGSCGQGDPGDHVTKDNSTVDWDGDKSYHFVFNWTPAGFTISVDGTVWFQDTFSDGNPYAPPNFRVSLGCYPRGESQIFAIYRNVSIKKN